MPVGVSAYVPLATKTLTATATTVTFSSISQVYRDLVLVATPMTSASNNVWFRINGDASSTYESMYMLGQGTSGLSGINSSVTYADISGGSTPTSTVRAQIKIDLIDYSATDKHKTFLRRSDQDADGTVASVQRWPSFAAITSLTLLPQSGNFVIGSTFTLYGVSA